MTATIASREGEGSHSSTANQRHPFKVLFMYMSQGSIAHTEKTGYLPSSVYMSLQTPMTARVIVSNGAQVMPSLPPTGNSQFCSFSLPVMSEDSLSKTLILINVHLFHCIEVHLNAVIGTVTSHWEDS